MPDLFDPMNIIQQSRSTVYQYGILYTQKKAPNAAYTTLEALRGASRI